MKFTKLKYTATVLAAVSLLAALPAHAGKTLDGIKSRGQIICGVSTGVNGFSSADSNGKWLGCRCLQGVSSGNFGRLRES